MVHPGSSTYPHWDHLEWRRSLPENLQWNQQALKLCPTVLTSLEVEAIEHVIYSELGFKLVFHKQLGEIKQENQRFIVTVFDMEFRECREADETTICWRIYLF